MTKVNDDPCVDNDVDQESEVETVIGLLKEGCPVHTGVAILTPNIDVSVRVDKRIHSALNSNGGFSGKLINGENVGKTSNDLALLWNEDHPEDVIDG